MYKTSKGEPEFVVLYGVPRMELFICVIHFEGTIIPYGLILSLSLSLSCHDHDDYL
jgi:hypothetical protein